MTFEIQYQSSIELAKRIGLTKLGYMSNETWHEDPARLLFVLSRYKFVAKMLAGKRKVLEIGCGDAFGTRVVQQYVREVTVCDADEQFIADIIQRMDSERWSFEALVHNPVISPLKRKFSAVYALDVLEHISPLDEQKLMRNIIEMLEADGVLLLGLPSLVSQQYASPRSKQGHINCKTADQLLDIGKSYFENCFLFSMNDEVIHTGFYNMAHYYILLCCHPKSVS